MEFEIEREEEKFKPIKIKLKIESMEELVELWCRLNLNPVIVNRENDYSSKAKLYNGTNKCKYLWNELDDILDDLIMDKENR